MIKAFRILKKVLLNEKFLSIMDGILAWQVQTFQMTALQSGTIYDLVHR
jgi:hypothetical protein